MSHLHQLLGLMCVCLIGFFAWASGIPDKGLRTGDIGHPWSTGEMKESVVRIASFLNESITYREELIKEPFTAGAPSVGFLYSMCPGHSSVVPTSPSLNLASVGRSHQSEMALNHLARGRNITIPRLFTVKFPT